MMKSNQKMQRFVRSLCKESLIKMNLQLFAEEGDGDGTEDEESISFKNQSELDSWFDTKLSKSLETAQARWQEETDKRIQEAEKKGQMTAEEKAQYELQQERDQLEAERHSLKREKDEATTIKRLAQDKLPDSLSGALKPLYGGEEKQLQEAYQAIAESFREAVESAVNERLANSAELPNIGDNLDNSLEKGSLGKRLAQESSLKNTKSKFFKN
ncbi:DUF4355 domain-containing protein [Enterococcus sp. DIV1420a]|uniref:DUF4355 domain-containing protein n=1 Tax=Enterococcus sp. DIV1420a TaxID=2774672 RepID=UPI003F1F2B27